MKSFKKLVRLGTCDKPLCYYEVQTDFISYIRTIEVYFDGKLHRSVTHELEFDWITYDEAVTSTLKFNRMSKEDFKKVMGRGVYGRK